MKISDCIEMLSLWGVNIMHPNMSESNLFTICRDIMIFLSVKHSSNIVGHAKNSTNSKRYIYYSIRNKENISHKQTNKKANNGMLMPTNLRKICENVVLCYAH